MKIETGGNVWVNPTQYEHYAGFLYPAQSEKRDNVGAVRYLKQNASSVSRASWPNVLIFPQKPYQADMVFAVTERDKLIECFEKELAKKTKMEKFDYRYANLCEVLAYCDIKASWHKNDFLVPGTLYQDERFHRYALWCSVSRMPMFDPKVTVNIKSWAPGAKLGTNKKIPLVKIERKNKC